MQFIVPPVNLSQGPKCPKNNVCQIVCSPKCGTVYYILPPMFWIEQ